MPHDDWSSRIPGLSQLGEDLRGKLERTARVRKIKAGAKIFGGEETPLGMLFLIEGTVRVHQQGDNGRDIVLYRVTSGESCVMTTACLFTRHNYFAEGLAETDVVAAEVPRATFDELVADSQEFRDFVFAAYSQRIVDLFHVIDDVVFGRMDLRIAERLVQLSDDRGVAHLTHQKLAAELGTAREVVSRQLNEFQQRGWIKQSRGQVRLLQADALARFAASG